MKTLSNHELSDKPDLLQEKNSQSIHNANVTETTKPLIDLNLIHTKIAKKVKPYEKALSIVVVFFFVVVGALIFTKLIARALDIESSAQEYVMLDYKDDLNKQAPYDAPKNEKE